MKASSPLPIHRNLRIWTTSVMMITIMNPVFTVNFPVQVEMPDESIISGNSEDELYDLIDAWYDQNPDEEDDPEIVFPIGVTLASDGSTVQVNDEETLESLLYSCFGDDFEYEIYATQGSTKSLVTMEERRAVRAAQRQ